jgi:cysteine desulfurase
LGDDVVKHLDQQRIMASTGSACTSHEVEASHVLKAIGLNDEWALGSVRLSLSRHTTAEEIKRTGDVVRKVVESLRRL